MDHTYYPISQSSFHNLSNNRKKTRILILALLVLSNMGCLASSWIHPNNNPALKFTPFKSSDCDTGGRLPAPDPGSKIYPNSIYCSYTGTTGENVQGLFVNFDMQYVEDPAKSTYASDQKIWADNALSLSKMEGAKSIKYFKNPPFQSVLVVVPDTDPGAQDMTANFSDLMLYKDHFIIFTNGGMTVTHESDAADIEEELIQYAIATADLHYK